MKNFTRMLLLVGCLLAVTASVFAQTPPNLIWAKTFGGTATEFVQKIIVDASGNTYATGYYQGTVNFDATQSGFTKTSRGSNDVFVAKYSPSGAAMWVRAFGGAAAEGGTDIKLDANGNVIVVGAYGSASMVVDTPSIIGVASVGSRDIFLVSFDNNGGFNWAKSMGGAGEDIPTAIEIDQIGHIYITGLFYGTSDFDPSGMFNNSLTANGITYDAFLAKYTSVGGYIWAFNFGSGDVDAAYGIAIAPNNDVVITGKMRQTVDFDPNGTFNVTVGGYEDAFVAAYTPSKALRYAFTFGGNSTNDVAVVNHIAFDSDKSIYLAGVFKGTVDFNPSPSLAANFAAATSDIFISKIDSSGKFQWVRNMVSVGASASGDEIVHDLVIDNDNNILITGLMFETVEFGHPATNQLTSNSGSDIFLAKYTPAGNNTWAFKVGGTNDGAYGIGIDSNNDIYLGGYFAATSPPAYFNPNNTNNPIQSINGNPDMFIAKYSETSGGCTNTASTVVVNQACDEYTSPSGNYTWYNTGTYNDTIPNTGGCDSVITINILSFGITVNTYLYESFCQGSSYTAPDGAEYYNAGSYVAVIPRVNGCDSIINIELTEVMVDASVNLTNTDLIAIATGAGYQWVDCNNNNAPINGATNATYTPTVSGRYGVNVTQNGCTEFSGCYTFTVPCTDTYGTLTTSTCGTYTSPSGTTYTAAGTFNDTIANAGGCDSIITITLTVGSVDATVTQSVNTLSVAATNANYQWLDCDNGNTAIASATSQTFSPSANGNYAVVVTQSTCTDTSACFAFTAVGITDVQQRVGISVYPNPTNSLLHVELTQPAAIAVYNMLGSLMARYDASQGHSIDVTNYAQGIYFIKAGDSIKRFVKQ